MTQSATLARSPKTPSMTALADRTRSQKIEDRTIHRHAAAIPAGNRVGVSAAAIVLGIADTNVRKAAQKGAFTVYVDRDGRWWLDIAELLSARETRRASLGTSNSVLGAEAFARFKRGMLPSDVVVELGAEPRLIAVLWETFTALENDPEVVRRKQEREEEGRLWMHRRGAEDTELQRRGLSPTTDEELALWRSTGRTPLEQRGL